MVGRDKGLRAVIEWGPNDYRRRGQVIEVLKEHFEGKMKFSHAQFYAVTQDQLEKEDFSFEAETGKNRFLRMFVFDSLLDTFHVFHFQSHHIS